CYHITLIPVVEEGDVKAITVYADDVTALASAQQALDESREALLIMRSASSIGFFNWDVAADILRWDETLCAMFGLPPDAYPKTFAEFVKFVHEDDRERLRARRDRVCAGDEVGGFDYRVHTANGSVRWMSSKVRTIRNASGQVIRVQGGVLDVTDPRRIEEQL